MNAVEIYSASAVPEEDQQTKRKQTKIVVVEVEPDIAERSESEDSDLGSMRESERRMIEEEFLKEDIE